MTSPADNPQPKLSPEWLAEIERRSRELDSGAVTPVAWEEIRRRLFNKYGHEAAGRPPRRDRDD